MSVTAVPAAAWSVSWEPRRASEPTDCPKDQLRVQFEGSLATADGRLNEAFSHRTPVEARGNGVKQSSLLVSVPADALSGTLDREGLQAVQIELSVANTGAHAGEVLAHGFLEGGTPWEETIGRWDHP